ncbi:MAG: hypothetical protein ACRDVG_02270, partial [Jatrophihabitantaceae bacterium]
RYGSAHRVRLPRGFEPAGITRGVVVGGVPSGNSYLVVLVDAASGAVRGILGTGFTLAIGHGLVVWAYGCYASIDQPCTLHSTAVAGGESATFRLPRPPGSSGGILSPDGGRIAFTMERAAQDTRFGQGHPIPPTDIAILDLRTGRLEIVPGIELPAKSATGLAFSPDGRWLVIALDAGTRTRLLAWRSGLAHPYETAPIRGPAAYGPPVMVVTGS